MTKRKLAGPSGTEWHTGIAYAYGLIDEEVAEELRATGVAQNALNTWGGLAEYAALARVADRNVAEHVAHMRLGRKSWADIGAKIGVTAQAAQQRFGKLPMPPLEYVGHDGPDGEVCHTRLRRDRKGWGCKCGAAGKLD